MLRYLNGLFKGDLKYTNINQKKDLCWVFCLCWLEQLYVGKQIKKLVVFITTTQAEYIYLVEVSRKPFN